MNVQVRLIAQLLRVHRAACLLGVYQDYHFVKFCTDTHAHIQVSPEVGRVLECSESVGLDRASSSHSSTGVRQALRSAQDCWLHLDIILGTLHKRCNTDQKGGTA